MPGAIADDVLYSRPRRDGPNVREARRAAGQRAQAATTRRVHMTLSDSHASVALVITTLQAFTASCEI
jgi:hypothetical protein